MIKTKLQKKKKPTYVSLPSVPKDRYYLLPLYDKDTECKEPAFLNFTYVLGNVCRTIQSCQNQSPEDLNSTCNPSCPLICKCLSIKTQASALSTKLVLFVCFLRENNLLPGKKKIKIFLSQCCMLITEQERKRKQNWPCAKQLVFGISNLHKITF